MLLLPKENFLTQKIIAWCLIGFFNPVSWAAVFISHGEFDVFSTPALALIWPAVLGASVFLPRLKRKSVHGRDLYADILIYAVLTIPIYTICIGVWISLVAGISANAYSDAASALSTVGGGLMVSILLAPLALPVGFFPAMLLAFLSCWIVRFTLFTKAPNPTPTP